MPTDDITDPDFTSDPALLKAEARRKFLERLDVVSLSEIETSAQEWLWPHRIPLGQVTLLAGDPGVGKSLLALDIVARVSRGAAWPDDQSQVNKELGRQGETDSKPSPSMFPCLPVSPSSSAPGTVILLSVEDNLADTIRPRLDEAGADCSRILAIRPALTIKDHNPFTFPLKAGEPKNFELRRDLRDFLRLIYTTPDCRLVVIDSMNAILSENSDRVRVDDWGLILRLSAIAATANVAVIIITHLRKKGGRAIYCNLGSLAFAAAARAVWAITKDPNSASGRLWLPIKNNLAADTSGLAFTIESGPTSGAPRIHWSPVPITASADCVVSYSRPNGRPDDERQHAKVWLRERLASGPCAVKELREEADAHGFTRHTLRRAFRELHGKAFKEPIADGPWYWQVPVEGVQNPRGEFWTPSNSPDEFANSADVPRQQNHSERGADAC